MDIWTVYRHMSPSGKIYIGITSNVKRRWANKGRYYCTYNSIFKNAIQKYGWDNIIHEVLVSNVGFKTACNIEKDLIAFNKANNISYNITGGGEGTLGRACSEHTKMKMRLSNGGVCRKAIEHSIISPNRKHSENLKLAWKVWKGSHHSSETILKMKQKAKGRDMTKAIKAMVKVRSIPITQFKNGVLIAEFDSIAQASSTLNINKSNISRSIKTGIKAGGFNFKIKEDDI